MRYIHGHNRRKEQRYVVFDTGHGDPCWVWKLAKTPDGYGQVSDSTGRWSYAHRVYYEQHFGPIPPDRQIDHLCRMPACVNPDHLEAVTGKENVRRGLSTKLTSAEVAEIRASKERQWVIARRYGVSRSHVSSIKTYRTWR
jgi:HNH endonuclease